MRQLRYKEAKPDMKVFYKTLKGEYIPHKIKGINDRGGYEQLSVQRLFKSGKSQKKITTALNSDFYLP